MIGCIARVRIHVQARRRAINSNPTSNNRMFVLIERRNMIDSGSNVPIFPTKERREVIEYRQRQFSTHLPSQSDLQINSQNKHNTTINKCWSRVGAVITVTYGPERDKTIQIDRSMHQLKSYVIELSLVAYCIF
jgi:hypothetical protein